MELGGRVRELYLAGLADPDRVARQVDAAYVVLLADEVTGQLGGRVGVAPRLFVKKLVDVLDRVDQFADFDPRHDYLVRLAPSELTDEERGAAGQPARPVPVASVDDVALDLWPSIALSVDACGHAAEGRGASK